MFGIQASQDVKLSNIARTLEEEIPLIKTEDRLSRVKRLAGRPRVQMLVAYGVRADGRRQLLGFLRSQGESQAAWEGLLHTKMQSRRHKRELDHAIHSEWNRLIRTSFIAPWYQDLYRRGLEGKRLKLVVTDG